MVFFSGGNITDDGEGTSLLTVREEEIINHIGECASQDRHHSANGRDLQTFF